MNLLVTVAGAVLLGSLAISCPGAPDPGLPPAVAASQATALVHQSRQGGGSRMLEKAVEILAPWQTCADVPVDIRLARATLSQSLHRFEAALGDLDAVVREDPQNGQAWLTKLAVHLVLGQYPEAAGAVDRLPSSLPPLVRVTAEVSVQRVAGDANRCYESLAASLAKSSAISPTIRCWSATLLAEIAVQLNRPDQARELFEEGLAANPSDHYTRVAYAEFLLDRNRREDVRQLVAATPNPSPDLRLLASLATGTEADATELHGAMLSRYQLATGKLEQALATAALNWRLQKEPRDAKALMDAALAADLPQAALPVLEWVRQTGIRHAELNPLVLALRRQLARSQ
ncbi:hypothetical protein BH23VER1_BH23VER1_05140 [soil metagenome]